MPEPLDTPVEIKERLGVPVERARTLPGGWYADPRHHELEMERVFRRAWVGVGLEDDVRVPGSYRVVSVGGVPVVVVRDDTGTLRAFLNVCRHRGAPIAYGSGSA